MSNLLVMKFGGTSMGSDERIRAAARLSIEQNNQRPTVVVVSAMSKITDLLLDSMRRAEGGDHAGLDDNLAQLTSRHQDACRGLLPAERQEHALLGIHALIEEFTGNAAWINKTSIIRPCRDEQHAERGYERCRVFGKFTS